MTWTKGSFTAKTVNGDRQITAARNGVFAVHRPTDGGASITLSHAPKGLAICFCRTQCDAKKIGDWLLRNASDMFNNIGNLKELKGTPVYEWLKHCCQHREWCEPELFFLVRGMTYPAPTKE